MVSWVRKVFTKVQGFLLPKCSR